MREHRGWAAARAEHDAALAGFLALVRVVPPEAWQRPLAPGKWSPAALALHVARAYEFGRDAGAGGEGMRLLVPPAAAWLAGRTILPLMLALGRFPRGAEAPREVAPDAEEARRMTPTAAVDRLEGAAAEAVRALAAHAGVRGAPRVRHAYFGTLPPRQALRLLSAHTRHHARGLAAALGTELAGHPHGR